MAGMFLAAMGPVSTATAENVAQFYKGKRITLFIGGGVGGGNDTTARSLGRHLENHIPGSPRIVAKNYPGSGGIRAVIALYNVGAKDGTSIGTSALGPVTEPLTRNKKFNYDMLKFHWIGSLKDEVQTCFVNSNTPIKTVQDAMNNSVTIASTGANSNGTKVPLLLNAVIGTQFKLVIGYGGPSGANLAVEKGETMGRCTGITALMSSRPQWLAQKKVNLLVQIGARKHKAMKGVPWVVDMVKSEEDRQLIKFLSLPMAMTTPIAMPPGTPMDKVKIMRTAFAATLKDPAFRAEAKKLQIELSPKTGDQVLAILKQVYATPPGVIKRAVVAFNTRKARCDPKTFKRCRKQKKRKKKK
jgi:tripartite-type tricarboxylate transporter receptor subunit TctC